MSLNTRLILIMISTLIVTSCKNKVEKNDTVNVTEQEISPVINEIEGSYVTDKYDQRSEGYDWVAVIVKRVADDEIMVSVRSRADQKKPSCTLDTRAYRTEGSDYEANIDGKQVLFTFGKNSITITPKDPADEAVLYFYCSGGATVAGTYTKTMEPLDESQIDKTVFSKVLRLQGIGFHVSSVEEDDRTRISITPFGFKKSNEPVTISIYGWVTGAEVEDLNSDGAPEILVYTSTGENMTGNVYGCSANGMNSMSLLYFPPTNENPQINQGYNGHDEFTLVETRLAQRFPLYENGERTGKLRQVIYKLENGETGRVFRVDQVSEMNMN